MEDLMCYETLEDIVDDDTFALWQLFAKWILEDFY